MRRHLKFGGRLDRYVFRFFAASLAVAFLLVVGTFLILDLSSNLDDFLQPGEDGRAPEGMLVFRYYLFQTPFVYLQVAPLVTLLAGLFTVARLMRHREVVAALAAGISSQRVLAPILVGGALVSLGMVGFREWATEFLGDRRDIAYEQLETRRPERVYEGVVLKDARGNFVKLEEFRAGTEADPRPRVRGLMAIERAADHWVTIQAEEAVWEEGRRWRLVDGRREDVDDTEKRRTPQEYLVGIDFTPRDVLVRVKAAENPFVVSGSGARYLALLDPSNLQYRTLAHYRLAFPAANLILLMVGVPFLLTFKRGRGVEGIAGGFLMCVFYFACDLFTRSLGMEGQLGPVFAAWLPPTGFGALGIVLYGTMRS